ncbi:class I SAM-dependent methyltransferase [Mycobacterium sp. SMC-15]|uniref:class I SAM-dependent methyltransferase n=1 Tax=Mycobacterium sp. SMC-15 TaxID=3381627 RepID=UPI0038760110
MQADPTFDAMYRGEQTIAGMVPWDIGGPQPVVQELVAHGALHGEVLDPGTGPGHHAIYFASQGYSATGIDASPAAIEHARRNAQRAGVTVDFRVADATHLAEFEGRFNTVVDSAFYHVFAHDELLQARYLQALHLATAPGARLFMFELGRHNLNGLQFYGLPADSFNRLLNANGWRTDYVGTSTYVGTFGPRALEFLSQMDSTDGVAPQMKSLPDQLARLRPQLQNDRVHLPMWSVAATRVD